MSILDCVLDDLADLPEFAVFPAGAHKALVTMKEKEINKRPAVEITLEYVEALELADPQEAVPAVGTTSSASYLLDNEFGQGAFKAVALKFADFASSRNLREIVAAVKKVECLVVTTIRKDKSDATKLYLNIKDIEVV